MSSTLFLLPDTWDLTLDSNNNIAIATDEYQQAQDIATSCRVFLADDYYNKQDGIPYHEIIGNSGYPLSLYQRNLYDRAKLVEGIVTVDIKLDALRDRVLSGAIMFTNDKNLQGTVGL